MAIMGVAIASILLIMFILPYDAVAFTVTSVVLAILAICLVVFSSMTKLR
jgi:hypothetical protein